MYYAVEVLVNYDNLTNLVLYFGNKETEEDADKLKEDMRAVMDEAFIQQGFFSHLDGILSFRGAIAVSYGVVEMEEDEK